MAEGPYSNEVYSEREAINAVWVLVSTAMIFFMLCGLRYSRVVQFERKTLPVYLLRSYMTLALDALVSGLSDIRLHTETSNLSLEGAQTFLQALVLIKCPRIITCFGFSISPSHQLLLQ